MNVRRLLLALPILLLLCAGARANDVYIAQVAAGGGTGLTSCANALVYTYFNSSGNWTGGTPTGAQIGPGTTVHLCGTFPDGPGNLLTTQGSGSSGNPITIKFESGGNITSAVWTAAVIQINHSFITVDGGGTGSAAAGTFVPNGIIQATASGTGLANTTGGGTAVNVTGPVSNVIVKNLTIANLYKRTCIGAISTCTDPNQGGLGISFINCTNCQEFNNTIHDLHWAVVWSVNGGNSISNFLSTGDNIYNVDHGAVPAIGLGSSGTQTGILVYGHHIHDFQSWDDSHTNYPGCATAPCNHHDAVHVFSFGGGVQDQISIYNLLIDGNFGVNTNAGIYMEAADEGGTITHCNIFNNVINPTLASATASGGIADYSTNGCFGVNNTVLQQGIIAGFVTSIGPTWYNNVVPGNANNQPEVMGDGHGAVLGPIDFNAFALLPTNGNGFVGAAGGCCISFSQWQTAGRDTHAVAAPPSGQGPISFLGLSVNYIPQTGSPLIASGKNLFSTCNGQPNPGLGALCFDKAGVARPTVSNWDIGAYQAASGVSIPAVPTGLTATASGSTINLSWTASTGTPAGYFVSRSTVSGGPYTQIANVTSGTSYADTGLANGTYYYVVAAYNSAGTSANSTQASATVSTTCSINLNPSSLAFGSVTQGTSSATQSITITNLGTATCTSLSVANPSNPDFGQTNTCGSSLAINATCSATVTFTPSIVGSELSALAVSSNDPASPETAPLSGTGVAAINITPISVTLTNTYVTKTSASAVVTVVNNSGSSVTFSSIAFSGGSSAIFNIDNTVIGHCTGTITNGSSCTITFSATPVSNGNFSSTLVITDSDVGSPHNIAVTVSARGHKVLKIGAVI